MHCSISLKHSARWVLVQVILWTLSKMNIIICLLLEKGPDGYKSSILVVKLYV